jgi:hypothetical protein
VYHKSLCYRTFFLPKDTVLLPDGIMIDKKMFPEGGFPDKEGTPANGRSTGCGRLLPRNL